MNTLRQSQKSSHNLDILSTLFFSKKNWKRNETYRNTANHSKAQSNYEEFHDDCFCSFCFRVRVRVEWEFIVCWITELYRSLGDTELIKAACAADQFIQKSLRWIFCFELQLNTLAGNSMKIRNIWMKEKKNSTILLQLHESELNNAWGMQQIFHWTWVFAVRFRGVCWWNEFELKVWAVHNVEICQWL